MTIHNCLNLAVAGRFAALIMAVLMLAGPSAPAQEDADDGTQVSPTQVSPIIETSGSADTEAPGYADDEKPGIDEKLGEYVPLDLDFTSMEGERVKLGDYITKPTVLTLVYLRCPSICAPLMNEVADTVDELELEPGIDFNLLTVSFDKDERADLVKTGRENLLGRMKRKIPPESWQFLVGDADNIAKLTDSVGFRFKREEGEFVHAGTVIFLSPEGQIVRYLPGLQILASNMELAILDAAAGNPRSFMQQLQRLCYSYDPGQNTYIFQVNRIILGVTLFGLGVFLVYLLAFRGRKKTKPAPQAVQNESRTDS